MLFPSRARTLARATSSLQGFSLPAFLVPALQWQPERPFSATATRPSKLGRTPISIPPGVELSISEPWIKDDPTTYLKLAKRTVRVQGPLGKLALDMPSFVHIEHNIAARRASLSIEDNKASHQKAIWGTTWAYLNRYIIGVSEGHTAVLRLVGIGYRATVEQRSDREEFPGQKFVILKLGFNHTVDLGVPEGISASAPQPTRILLEGINREQVMSFAAQIRKWRRPEPYKGKGIFVNDETIKLKQKKIK